MSAGGYDKEHLKYPGDFLASYRFLVRDALGADDPNARSK